MILNKTELFIIETNWFDSPFDNLVYTDLQEAERLAEEYNNRDGRPGTVGSSAIVMNIEDYAGYCRDKGSEAARYD